MGFRDAEWAYDRDLRSGIKVVLVAICHRTDDKTHETFVGRRTLATMVGMTERAISKALAELEHLQLITRTARRRVDGYRDTDLLTVNRTPQGNTDQGKDDHVNEIQGNGDPASGERGSDLRGTTFKASRSNDLLVTQGSPIDQAFERAYARWPKKIERKKSRQAFERAAKTRGLEQLTEDVIRFGDAYAATTDRQFVPALPAWLNGERWTDDPPTPKPPTQAEWDAVLASAAPSVPVASLDPCSGGHRWMPDGTCNLCPARREAGAA